MRDLQAALREIDEVIALRVEADLGSRPSAAQALYQIDRILRQTLDRDGAVAPLPHARLRLSA